jgi:quercetin dioxygenase-like cupin family protein
MEIRRFGPGHRRPDGPPGTQGVTGQVIFQDGRGTIAELAFGPRAMIAPHTNENTTLLVVVSGGGFVQVGDERARISHGEAVVWPAGEVHGAWTDGTEMRVLVVEFTGPDDTWALDAAQLPRRTLLIGHAARGPRTAQRDAADPAGATGATAPVEPGRGSLAEPGAPAVPDPERDASSGEPW